MTNKTKRTIIIINSSIVSLMIGGGAVTKIIKIEKITDDFTKLGVNAYTQMLGVLEIILLALLFYPRTMRIGFFLLCCYFGGAIATQLSHNGMFLLPAVPLFFIWLNVFLRDKYLFKPSSNQFMNFQQVR
jgi:hypothetical protein